MKISEEIANGGEIPITLESEAGKITGRLTRHLTIIFTSLIFPKARYN
jgi:hypothetical protein